MGVPKSRRTKHHQRMRRMHIYLRTPNFINCPQCKKEIPAHQVCPFCGFYKGKQIIDFSVKLSKKEKKQKQKESLSQ